MDARIRLVSQEHVSCDRSAFRCTRYAAQSSGGSVFALVHNARARYALVLAVRYERQPECFGVLERIEHDRAVVDGQSVVGHGYCARALHLAELAQFFAALSARDTADGIHFGIAAFFRPTAHITDRSCVVYGRHGIGHATHGGISARKSGCRAAFYVFLMRLPRFAQMTVHIYKTGKNELSVAVHYLRIGFVYIARHAHYIAAVYQYVRLEHCVGIDHRRVF